MAEEIQIGSLYLVSTPIGNLEDITFRAVRILKSVDLVAAEDTRTTRVLLDHYEIRKPLVSYYSYNEVRRGPQFIRELKAGKTIALVSDAGTPGISDPAYRIIRDCLDEGIPIHAVPGPTAAVAALIISGLAMDRFIFEGFLPLKKGRKGRLEKLRTEDRTIILFESPHRLLKTLQELFACLGDRNVSVSRELTKKFEETFRGKLSTAKDYFSRQTIRGEFVIVLDGLK